MNNKLSLAKALPIQSNGNVDLTVTLAGSAGKLKTPGEIQLKIPKTIVADSKQLQTGLRIDKPFYVGNNAVTDEIVLGILSCISPGVFNFPADPANVTVKSTLPFD